VTGEPNSKQNRRRPPLERDDEPMMDINEVAAFINTNVCHIRRLVSERRIPHYKVGGKLRFGRRETHDWLASLRVPEQEPMTWPIHPGRRRAS
jgi:excisionase family DNA binding protein